MMGSKYVVNYIENSQYLLIVKFWTWFFLVLWSTNTVYSVVTSDFFKIIENLRNSEDKKKCIYQVDQLITYVLMKLLIYNLSRLRF